MSPDDHKRETTPTPSRLRARLIRATRKQRDHEREQNLAVWRSLALSLFFVIAFYFLAAGRKMSGFEFFFVWVVLFLILLAMELSSLGPAPK